MPSENALKLILFLSRTKPEEGALKKASEAVRKGIEWERFLGVSRAHGVAPLVYENLRRIEGVPPDVSETLKMSYLRSLNDSIKAMSEFEEISASLKGEGVEIIPLKGIIYAEELFENPALYPSADIDVMLRREDVEKTLKTMEGMGYKAGAESDGPFLDTYHEVSLYRENRKPVEFHLAPGKGRYFDIPEDYWWEGLRELVVGKRRFKALSKEKTLLFAAIHLFFHGCAPLKFIVTISEALRLYGTSMNWQGILEDAKRFGALKPLLLSLDLAGTLLEAPLPEEVRRLLKERSFKEKWVSGKMVKMLFKENARLSEAMLVLTFLNYGPSETLGRLIRWVFPPLREVSVRYGLPRGSKKVFFYYLMNPVFLALRKRGL